MLESTLPMATVGTLISTPGFFWLQRGSWEGGRHVTPIHHRSAKSNRKARVSSSAEVQALAVAEQEL